MSRPKFVFNIILLIAVLGIFFVQAGFAAHPAKKPGHLKHCPHRKLSKSVIKKTHKTKKTVTQPHENHSLRKHSHKKLKSLKGKHLTIKRAARRPAPVIMKPVASVTTVNTSNIFYNSLPAYLLTSMEKNLVHFVRNTIASIHYTTYKLGGTKIDPSRGIYEVDCSSYVDHILKTVYPKAYTSIATWSGTQKPTTHDFYQYFKNLAEDSPHWNTINDVEQLRPGDILVFRNKNRTGAQTGGHIMIVMDQPERSGNTFLIRIADSAPSGHSKDTRLSHGSGVGIGSMLLKVNPHTLLPNAYAWKVGARWESNVNFAMARPVDFS